MGAVRQFGLFGGQPEQPRIDHRTTTPARGHAAPPGTGPVGETCGSCAQCRMRQLRPGKRFYKCGLMVAAWTGGRGSDVLLHSPACSKWEPGAPRVTTIHIKK